MGSMLCGEWSRLPGCGTEGQGLAKGARETLKVRITTGFCRYNVGGTRSSLVQYARPSGLGFPLAGTSGNIKFVVARNGNFLWGGALLQDGEGLLLIGMTTWQQYNVAFDSLMVPAAV